MRNKGIQINDTYGPYRGRHAHQETVNIDLILVSQPHCWPSATSTWRTKYANVLLFESIDLEYFQGLNIRQPLHQAIAYKIGNMISD